jgi:hypothetical protein
MKSIVKNILLTEGRKEDAYKKYVTKAEDGPIKDRLRVAFDTFVNNDPSGNHKYIDWMLKMMVAMMVDRGADYPDYHENGVVDVVTNFHQNTQRLPKKDINQYKSVKELDDAVKSLPETRKAKKLKGADKIFEDDNILVVTPKTQEGSCYYGSGSKWCVAARNDGMFDDYHSDGYLYFIIWKLTMPDNMKQYQKVARYIPHGYEYETEGEYYTATDTSISQYALEYDLFGRRNEYHNTLGYTMAKMPEQSKPFWDSWESAKIRIDTHYAKNGMNKPNRRRINPMGDGDGDDWGDDDLDFGEFDY